LPDDLDARLTAALADRYALERELGRGGMATVYLARDVRHERRVALKVMRPEIAVGLGAERFLREIRIAAQLSHPHILPLFDSGEAAGLLFYVMPYVEGESLRDRLVREKQLPLEEALRLGAEVAGALAHAHSRGVVHRDIKPENILLEGGHARVADFGIARAVHAAGGETLTETGLAVGTPAYMSPEQAAGAKELDARSDIYSLGCVLYEMLGGEVPYLGTTPQSIFAKKMSGPPPLLSALRDTVSPELERVVEKALARSPADRWSGAQPLADALFAAATGLAGAESTPGRRRLRVPLRRWRTRALVAGVTVLALVAASWAVVARRGPGLDPKRVMVAPFENATGDTALGRLGIEVSEWISQGLVQANIPGIITASAILDSTAGAARVGGEVRLQRLALPGTHQRRGDGRDHRGAGAGLGLRPAAPPRSWRDAPAHSRSVGLAREPGRSDVGGRRVPASALRGVSGLSGWHRRDHQTVQGMGPCGGRGGALPPSLGARFHVRPRTALGGAV